MRVVVQRVSQAEVKVGEVVAGAIQTGLLVFVGIEDTDTAEDIAWISSKIIGLRIFNDSAGVMNVGIKECGGNILLISQFTLHASTKKGNRPSYIKAAKPPVAVPLYEKLIQVLTEQMGAPIATGIFGADMQVSLINDGPVTILMDSKNKE